MKNFCEKIMANLQEMVVFSFSNDEQSLAWRKNKDVKKTLLSKLFTIRTVSSPNLVRINREFTVLFQPVHYNISNLVMLGTPSSTPGEIDVCAH